MLAEKYLQTVYCIGPFGLSLGVPWEGPGIGSDLPNIRSKILKYRETKQILWSSFYASPSNSFMVSDERELTGNSEGVSAALTRETTCISLFWGFASSVTQVVTSHLC